MLDIKLVRENPDLIDEAMANRNTTWDRQRFQKVDEERRALIVRVEELQAERNSESKRIGQLMRDGATDEAETAKERVREVNERIDELSGGLGELEVELEEIMSGIPNIPGPDTPVGADEDDNVEVKRWGEPRTFDFEPEPHWDLGEELGIIDAERAVKLTGSRFTLLAGYGARLERALINFMVDTHVDRGYKEWRSAVIANTETLYGTGQLPKFEDDLFRIEGDRGYYLIPTAEVMLTNIHRGEVLEGKTLPLHYCEFSNCFREEAGSAGRDTRGLIRVHEFHKVEMVKLAKPEESDQELALMVEDAENILQQLGLPYRILALCTGDIGFSARQTFDLEVYLPSYGGYKEISSCSNCGDFQARRAAIKYRDPEEFKGSRFVHTLNGSGLAVDRCLAAVIENYQEADGSITVPDVLVPYMGGITTIPAVD